jgi:hypothetical protein
MWRVLVMSLAILSTAHAGVLRDPESGLTIAVAGPDATVCYVRPTAQRDAGCAGKNVDAIEAQLARNQRVMAVVDSPDASYVVGGLWLATLVEGPITRGRDVEEVFREAREALKDDGYALVDKIPELVTVHGLQLLTFAATSPRDGALVEYVVRAGGSLIVIQFGGDVALPKLRELAATAIATLSLSAPETSSHGPPALAIAIVLATTSCALLAFIALRLRRSGGDDDDLELWALQQRRSAGLRIAAVGELIWVPAMIWLVIYVNWDTSAPVTRIKVVGGTAVAIGLALTIAGFIMIVRARRRPLPAAIARKG